MVQRRSGQLRTGVRPHPAATRASGTSVSVSPDAPRFQRTLSRWGRTHRRAFPWRQERDPFRILVAEILVQRSRSSTVEVVYRALFERWPTADALARAQVRSIAAVIRPLGLVSRAPRLKELARYVAAHGVPKEVERLLELPGVGRYAANAAVAVAHARRSPTVDAVSARVYRRYFGLPEGRPAITDPDLWELVEQVTPARGARTWNWSVLDLAAAICLPRMPRCGECPLRATCATAAHG